MTDRIQITSNALDVLRAYALLPAETRAKVKAGLTRALLLIEDEVRRKSELKARRGAAGLMGRLTSNVQELGSLGVDGVIGFRKRRGFPYELAQEFGATARPGHAMAIPITGESRRLSDLGQGPRQFPRKLFIPFKAAGNKTPKSYTGRTVGILAEFLSRNRIRPQYVLVKSIRPRLHFRRTVLASTGTISREIEGAVK